MAAPSSIYRNAIDLNRYSNSVARRIVVAYNDVAVNAINQLKAIDELSAPAKAARQRAILAQLKESLATWAQASSVIVADELQGLAELQSDFITKQLRKLLPSEAASAVNTVEVSPQFAQSVVMTDPTQINVVNLSDDLQAAVTGAPQTFSLTAGKGATVTLPNGQVVQKAFRGIADSQADLFAKTIRTVMLSGQSINEMARNLVGTLQLEQKGSLKQLAKKGGAMTTATGNQVSTLVRTSVNQVANAASQQVYQANQDVTEKYRYRATLDSRTSVICASLDGQEFEYGKGPTPPQHFNCRSTTEAIIDYKALGFDPPKPGKRQSMDGLVDANVSYGKWLKDQGQAVQSEVLGPGKARYFRKLSAKNGPEKALSMLIRADGSELTLDQLRDRYGDLK